VKRLLLSALLLVSLHPAEARLSPLATPPDWSRLNVYQGTISRTDFVDLLDRVYAPNGAWHDYITVTEAGAVIRTSGEPFVLRFAPDRASAKAPVNSWRPRGGLPHEEPGKPLEGLRIAIDPGHIGGPWAQMEERWFKIGNTKPVTEGDMTLKVAKLLVPRLEALGAEVMLTRSKAWPVTSTRPGQLTKAARASLEDKKADITAESLQKESERLFYRVAEIRRRAKLVNETFRPDLVLCLHFNAEAWGDEKNPKLLDENHLHFLVTGSFSASELDYEDQRFEMLTKLLNRSLSEEVAVTNALSKSMTAQTGLPPYLYRQANAIRINGNPYLWARNLLANRLFTCPVVYVEPYVMNNKLVFDRIQAGDYDGRKEFGGAMRKSIYREYADGIVDGLLAYYSKRSL